MAINLDEVNTLTTKRIMPGLVDQFFKNGALLAYFKRNRYKVWQGGPQIQESYLFKPMKGQWYAKGSQFDISKRQTKSGLLFDPRFLEVNVTEFLEDLEVIFRDPVSGIDLLEADMATAAMTMSALLAVSIYRHGQNVGGIDRTLKLNGLEEALTDGTSATWSQAAPGFLSYGAQTRADVAPALNSPLGQISSPSIGGQITYRILEQTYQSCVIGDEHPVIGVTTNRCMGYINENFQPQQKLDTVEPVVGLNGIKFKGNATIIQDQYCPGQDISQQDIDELDAVRPATGETFWWFNPGGEGEKSYLNLYFSASPKFQFGFTGFKDAQDSTAFAGQILFGGNFTCRSPRLNRGIFAITG